MDNLEKPISRRKALKIALGAAISGAALTTGIDLVTDRKTVLQPITPENTTAPFSIGKTNFFFDNHWPEEKRRAIRKTLQENYWKVTKLFGSQPVDMANREGVSTLIHLTDEQGNRGKSSFVFGTSRADLRLSENVDESTIVHEFGHLAWGPLKIMAEGAPSQYDLLNEGVADIAAMHSLNQNEPAFFKEIFKLTTFDPELANKPSIALYGIYFNPLQGIRRTLAARALKNMFDEDPRFIERFRNNYYRDFSTLNELSDFTISRIRSLLKKSFSGNFGELEQKHNILGEAKTGRQIIIAPTLTSENQEVLATFIVDRKDEGFSEEAIANTPVIIIKSINNQRPDVFNVTNHTGAIELLSAAEYQTLKNSTVKFQVITDFGSQSVTLNPKTP